VDRAGARLANNRSIRKCRYEVLSGISVLGWPPHLRLLRTRSTNGRAAALLRSKGRRDQPSGQEGRDQENGERPDVVCQPDTAIDRNNVPLAESGSFAEPDRVTSSERLAKSGGFAEPDRLASSERVAESGSFAEPDAFACQPMMPTRQAPFPKCR
jgi:hypothetical protein